MRYLLGALALAVSALFASAPANAQACTTNCFPVGDTTYTIQSGGLARTYLVHVPQNYNPAVATPLLVALHGLGSTSEDERDAQKVGAESDTRGFIAIFPQGYGKEWNGSGCCVATDSVYRDDVAFLRTVIGEAKARANIDSNRVYVMGHSAGGAMAHRFGCEAADLVKAIVAIAQRLNKPAACSPVRPVNVLEIDGLLDPLVDYYGLNVLGYVSAQASFASWATLNNCQGAVVTGRIERPAGDLLGSTTGSLSRTETFTNCAAGVKVRLVTIGTGTHTPDTNLEGFKLVPYVWDYLQTLS